MNRTLAPEPALRTSQSAATIHNYVIILNPVFSSFFERFGPLTREPVCRCQIVFLLFLPVWPVGCSVRGGVSAGVATCHRRPLHQPP